MHYVSRTDKETMRTTTGCFHWSQVGVDHRFECSNLRTQIVAGSVNIITARPAQNLPQ